MPAARAFSFSPCPVFFPEVVLFSSPAHNPSTDSPERGFTLVELIVVLALLVITLSFTFPQVSRMGFLEGRNKMARWVIATVTGLKARAVMEQRPYALRVDTEGRTLTAMQAPAVQDALKRTPAIGEDVVTEAEETKEDGDRLPPAAAGQFKIPGDLTVTGVLFAGRDTVLTGTVDILFHTRGYSDRAVIHMKDGDRRFSFIIEPFLSQVKVVEGHATF